MKQGKLASLVFTPIVLSLCVQQAGVSILAAADAGPGVIEGTVRYEDGNPVNSATVYAATMNGLQAGIVPNAKTDETGHFAIRHLWLGKYAVAAEKLDEAYPNMTNQFYSAGKFETVILTARYFAASVTVRLGPKAGVLVGTVADAVTGAPLNEDVRVLVDCSDSRCSAL
jgi:hypothetical protein